MKLRALNADDRSLLAAMLARIDDFTKEDQALALELIDFSIANPHQKDYQYFIAADEHDQPIAYVCYGPTPLTEGTYDLYWIAVDPGYAGKGIGTQLMQAVEQDIRQRQGRMLIIETSSSEHYEATRQFYLKKGYALVETIHDFYRPGEDRVTYIKKFPS